MYKRERPPRDEGGKEGGREREEGRGSEN